MHAVLRDGYQWSMVHGPIQTATPTGSGCELARPSTRCLEPYGYMNMRGAPGFAIRQPAGFDTPGLHVGYLQEVFGLLARGVSQRFCGKRLIRTLMHVPIKPMG